MAAASPDEVFAALRSDYAYRLDQGTTLIDLRRSGNEAVFIFRWPNWSDIFGVPVSLTKIDKRLDWNRPARDLSEWLESVDLWIMEDVENGLTWRAGRREVDDYIELRSPGWPNDERFYASIVTPNDAFAWKRTEFVRRDGLDPSWAIGRREDRTLVAWVTYYENNSSGSPYVAQATLVRNPGGEYCVDFLEALPGAPEFLKLDIVRTAAMFAAERGTSTVRIDAEIDHLDVIGCETDPTTERRLLDTRFLNEDYDRAHRLLEAEKGRGSRWGDNRDRAGRYLPSSRLGRQIHRLRYGISGTPPRRFVG
jgi:hypothetical protein